jgi:hypothetical protein
MADKAKAVGRVIVLVGLAGVSGLGALPAAAHVPSERDGLQRRVEAVRAALQAGRVAPGSAGATLVAEAANWNNWPKWSKWSNWANQ